MASTLFLVWAYATRLAYDVVREAIHIHGTLGFARQVGEISESVRLEGTLVSLRCGSCHTSGSSGRTSARKTMRGIVKRTA